MKIALSILVVGVLVYIAEMFGIYEKISGDALGGGYLVFLVAYPLILIGIISVVAASIGGFKNKKLTNNN